jgi:hypothetical protein
VKGQPLQHVVRLDPSDARSICGGPIRQAHIRKRADGKLRWLPIGYVCDRCLAFSAQPPEPYTEPERIGQHNYHQIAARRFAWTSTWPPNA